MPPRLVPPPPPPVPPRRDQPINNRWAEEQMVDTEACVPGPRVSEVVPKGVDALAWMKRPHRISPALREQAMERLPDLRPEQRIIDPALRLMNVEFGGHHIEIVGEHNGHPGREELPGMRGQPIEP